jgi:hypothetical protein
VEQRNEGEEMAFQNRTGLDEVKTVKQVRYNFIDSSADILGSPRATAIARHRLNVKIGISTIKAY